MKAPLMHKALLSTRLGIQMDTGLARYTATKGRMVGNGFDIYIDLTISPYIRLLNEGTKHTTEYVGMVDEAFENTISLIAEYYNNPSAHHARKWARAQGVATKQQFGERLQSRYQRMARETGRDYGKYNALAQKRWR